jgi:ribosomal protein S18 acetylase RimI-like enzyme
MHFVFTTEQTGKRADEIVDYLLGPRLWIPQVDYPDFDVWATKVPGFGSWHTQLKKESKRAIIALARESVIGAIIYQRHQVLPDVLEIKNITVRPDARGRFMASFLLRNAEVEGAHDFGSHEVLVDAKARNTAIRTFLLRNSYKALGIADLYGLGAGEDVVYRKRLIRA